MRKRTARYMKWTAVDYALIALAFLLVLSFLGRVVAVRAERSADRACRAEVTFVLRDLTAREARRFAAHDVSFTMRGGTVLSADTVDLRYQRTERSSTDDETGTERPLFPTAARYSVYFTFEAKGERASDRAFLFDGARLEPDGTLSLLYGDEWYTADCIRVRTS